MHDRDYIARAIAEGGQIRAFALTSRLLVEQAKKIHDYSPVSIAALGRTLSAALMMGDMLKGDRDLVTLIIKGDGPLKQIVATADSKGDVKGYAAVPDLELPLKPNGHLDVGRAVGKGTLTVIRDLGMREPYVGTVDLVSGEIAEDVTYYFAESEQIPTACGLGVLVDTDYTIRAAGGFLIQLMPGAQEKTVARLEQNLAHVKSVTDLLKSGETPEGLITTILQGFDVEITSTREVRFLCNCSKERFASVIKSLGPAEIDDMITKDRGAELTCNFCGAKYYYTAQELEAIKADLEATRSKGN